MDALLSLKNVSKTYHLGKTIVHALHSVSLDVGACELVALSGPSGSGKSTLLNTCGLIDSPDEGEYLLGGKAMLSLSSKELTRVRRDKIGFVFQSFNLIPVMTASENIEYPLLLTGLSNVERRKRV
ncbi:MAG: ATP-binding cassette domain-containing protein, partial [Gammaproteobacteria bacterium]|nr:ATP-binding cassette domain-containing protein [Gammaproteobacteria bacterium]